MLRGGKSLISGVQENGKGGVALWDCAANLDGLKIPRLETAGIGSNSSA